MTPRAATLSALREQIRRLERVANHGLLPFGVAAIDAALPDGGLALGAVHEILGIGGDEEDGAVPCGFIAAILARLGESPILWCQKRPDLYGPGLAAQGLDPARLVLAAAPRDEDVLWVAEEALRAAGLAAVVGEIGRLPLVAGRRLQLAAERSGIPLFVLRRWRSADEAAVERGRPSAALTRWRVGALPSAPASILGHSPLEGPYLPWSRGGPLITPSPTLPRLRGREGWGQSGGKDEVSNRAERGLGLGRPRWRVELLRARGGRPGVWEVEVDATGYVSLSAGLADRSAAPDESDAAMPRRRRAG